MGVHANTLCNFEAEWFAARHASLFAAHVLRQLVKYVKRYGATSAVPGETYLDGGVLRPGNN
jgi:hypothetical protein